MGKICVRCMDVETDAPLVTITIARDEKDRRTKTVRLCQDCATTLEQWFAMPRAWHDPASAAAAALHAEIVAGAC